MKILYPVLFMANVMLTFWEYHLDIHLMAIINAFCAGLVLNLAIDKLFGIGVYINDK